jgi:hypothetical protein
MPQRAVFHEDFHRPEAREGGSSRGFGLVFCMIFAFLALRPLLGGGAVRWWALALAAALLLVSLTRPSLLDVANRAWLRVGRAMSRVVNPVVLGILFLVVITPTALISRMLGRDPLRLRMDRAAATYWIDRTTMRTGPVDMRKQF